MATKKPGKAVKKNTTGKDMAQWKEQLKKFAKEEESTITVSEGNFISILGGEFSYRGNVLPEPFQVVILDHCFENQFYDQAYDPNNPQLPICFAINKDVDVMAPGEAAPDKQSETCADCPQNVFGSADTGRGKACKNGIRLLVIPGDKITLESVEDAEELAVMKLPPTSLKYFNGYARKLIKSLEVPTFGAITSLSLEKLDPKDTYKVVKFEYVDMIPANCIAAIVKLREANQDMLLKEYDETQYKAQQTQAKAGRKTQKKFAGKKPVKQKPSAKKAPSRF